MEKNNYTSDINNEISQLSKQEVALYITATPIGNLEDITIRALNLLKNVEFIACEDTRVTGKLLARYGINAKMICYNDFSSERDREKVLSIVANGKSVALVSDAGTPLISDPGYKLVREATMRNIKVIPLPGASSVLAALVLSAMPTNRFLFEGFLPPKKAGRIKALNDLKHIKATIIFFETARRIANSLEDVLEVMGDREAAVVREITKRFEEAKRGKISELLDFYKNDNTKGEIVVVLSPPVENEDSDFDLDTEIEKALKSMSVKDAAAFLSDKTGINKKEIYGKVLEAASKRK